MPPTFPPPSDHLRTEIASYIVDLVCQLQEGLRREEVRTDASLVGDLGLDSTHIATLVAKVKERYGQTDLSMWFISAARGGTDTIDGLAAAIGRNAVKAA